MDSIFHIQSFPGDFSNMSVSLVSTGRPEHLRIWVWADGERAALLSAEVETKFEVIANAISVVIT